MRVLVSGLRMRLRVSEERVGIVDSRSRQPCGNVNMNIKIKNLSLRGLIVATLVLFVTVWSIKAEQLTFDQFGDSSYLPGYLVNPDPTGGVPDWDVLMYDLPFAGNVWVAGDLSVYEGSLSGDLVNVIRFDGNGHLIYYSSGASGITAPADVPYPPSPPLDNIAETFEVGGYAYYTPTEGLPGYDLSNPTYRFSEVPEPGTGALVALGAGLLLVVRRRHQR